MPRGATFVAVAVLALVATACGPARAPVGESADAAGRPATPQQPLIAVIRIEPRTLAYRVSVGSGRTAQDFVNAGLSYRDTQDIPQPYLVDELPRLGTDTWRVFPDG